MKKIIPLIIVLIALSIVGIIIIQLSWFSNLFQVTEESFLDKIDKTMYDVTRELAKPSAPGNLMNLQRKSQLFPNSLDFGNVRHAPISEHYTTAEVYNKLKRAFVKEGLKKLNFEFAITSEGDNYLLEMQSKNYIETSVDTLHTFQRIMPVSAEINPFIDGSAYEQLVIAIPDFRTQVWQSLIWMVAGAALFTLIVIAAFYITVKTMLVQRKLSLIKSDFINNMTHELKTPLATISLAVDAVRNEKVQKDPGKLQYFSGIIKEESKRMNKHVETILQAGLMEKQDIKMNMVLVSVHDVIKKVTDGFQLQLQEKNGKIELFFNAADDMVVADESHFTNMINNLVDNAVKYSKENPLIRITTHNTSKSLVIRIDDNGIGMSKETVKRIFEKFYRAHTGNIHNVKGFGLGMSYVKTVVDTIKGKIKVDSTLGKGSTFIVEIPLGMQPEEHQ
ncbi:MAG TPA: HAMP domain-containing sensor histidine kinase [Chitinophagaceae bacterium]|nr:HAMP domain-containing sensor histidine kinase [Chitinophagaceae bacterium]